MVSYRESRGGGMQNYEAFSVTGISRAWGIANGKDMETTILWRV